MRSLPIVNQTIGLIEPVPADGSRSPRDAPPLPDFDGARAEDILAWAVEEYFPDIAVACSMQDAVVVDLAVKIEPRIEVFFLETGFHFPETLETARRLRERYAPNLVELKPVENPAMYEIDGYEACCHARKVLPLERYLVTKRAWVSGVRRADSLTRKIAQEVEWDPRRRIVKINPIVGWSDDEVSAYVEDNDVVINPLRERGYESIGCWPCTQPGTSRDGRWEGKKLECGLHTYEPSLTHPPDPY
ncbi:MAG: phosphoadenylyl-sulfate reductase [Actinomycetota bacterium]